MRHNGAIETTSKPGEGSTFEVILPKKYDKYKRLRQCGRCTRIRLAKFAFRRPHQEADLTVSNRNKYHGPRCVPMTLYVRLYDIRVGALGICNPGRVLFLKKHLSYCFPY